MHDTGLWVSNGRAIRTLTEPPARNQPRPGVWSISMRLRTTASRWLGLNAHGNWLSGVPPSRPAKTSSSAERWAASARSSTCSTQLHGEPASSSLYQRHEHDAERREIDLAHSTREDPPRQRPGALPIGRAAALRRRRCAGRGRSHHSCTPRGMCPRYASLRCPRERARSPGGVPAVEEQSRPHGERALVARQKQDSAGLLDRV